MKRRNKASDTEEIIAATAHIPDRDQEFEVEKITKGSEQWRKENEDLTHGALDQGEGDTGVVSDPTFDRDGSDRILRSSLGDTSVEEHMSPAGRVGGNGDLTYAELRLRAKALSVPGRGKMTKAQLSIAVHNAM